jgi:hypothetical protein
MTAAAAKPPILDAMQGRGPLLINPPATSLLQRKTEIAAKSTKILFYGGEKSGKSTTAAELAIAISKEYYGGAPVAMHDTEPGSDYLLPLYQAEGVELLVRQSRKFTDMVTVLEEAEKEGCCCFVQDQNSHTWDDLTETYKRERRITGDIQYQHWADIKQIWNEQWVKRYLASPINCIVLARAADDYASQEKEGTDRMEMVKTGTKAKTEKYFAYEPSLIVEMQRVLAVNGSALPLARMKRGVKPTGLIHRAIVWGDRTRRINGQVFDFPGTTGYKKGEYRDVWKQFRPHLEFHKLGKLNVGGAPHQSLDPGHSSGLATAENGSEYMQKQRRKVMVLGELKETYAANWPGSSEAVKSIKRQATEVLLGVRSWESVEQAPLDKLELALRTLQKFEGKASEDKGATETSQINLLANCFQEVRAEAQAEAELPF